jgi:hypothetical protein
MKARKMLIFTATKGHFLLDSMGLAGFQINLIDVNFHLQKRLEIFEKKSGAKKDKGWKIPCLMPIRVNCIPH